MVTPRERSRDRCSQGRPAGDHEDSPPERPRARRGEESRPAKRWEVTEATTSACAARPSEQVAVTVEEKDDRAFLDFHHELGRLQNPAAGPQFSKLPECPGARGTLSRGKQPSCIFVRMRRRIASSSITASRVGIT